MRHFCKTIDIMKAFIAMGTCQDGDTITVAEPDPRIIGAVPQPANYVVIIASKNGAGVEPVVDDSPRDILFKRAQEYYPCMLHRSQFDEAFEKGKNWVIFQLINRKVAVTFEEALRVTGTSKTRLPVVLSELEAEGRIVCNHMPDGVDTYEVAK